jgi:hypothetical protein
MQYSRICRVLTPRYSLRTLLILIALSSLAVHFGPPLWQRYVRYTQARQYASLQATKDWPPGSPKSFAIDDGRGIPDDFVILVRRGDTFGCFIPHNQCQKGESVEYEWFYRTDGGGRLTAHDEHVESGHGFAGPYVTGSGQSLSITFGPFSIPWSGHGKGWGFAYYDYNPVPRDRSAPDVLRICSTKIKNPSLLDARDARWLYKSCREDAGLPGNQAASDSSGSGSK